MRSFSIRSSTIRLGIFISTLVIAALVIFQLAWLRKVYRYEEKEFDHGIVKVIRGLYEDLDVTTFNAEPLNALVERPRPYLYLARINLPVNTDTLASYLQYELEDFDVFTACEVAIYDSTKKAFTWTDHIGSPGSNHPNPRPMVAPLHRPYNYIALYFPNRSRYILSQLNVWLITSIVLLIVIVLFGTSLYFFYRQKFMNQVQKDLLYNFAHEFKTPVSVISLAGEVLEEKNIAEQPARLATYAGIVSYQANYLNQQVERLLEFAYLESRNLPLRREKVDMHQLLKEAIDNLQPRIEERKATLQYDLQAGDPVLIGDRNYLLIVITNLIDNAVKYSKSPTIKIVTRIIDDEFSLSVIDNGIGIEKAELKKIFRKFYRAQHDETYAAKGFGLGLSFTKSILAAHNGRITVASQPGLGSVFEIRLPLD